MAKNKPQASDENVAPRPRRKKAKSPFRWLQRLLLLIGILLVGGVGLMLAAYGFGKAGQVAPEANVEQGEGDGSLTRGKGFTYTQTLGDRRIFTIKAQQSRRDREENLFLEGVELVFYREDGSEHVVTSDSATFHEVTKQALLEGHVLMRGWENLELNARALEVRQQGQVVESIGEVQFRYPPELVGRASSLRVDRSKDTVLLSGGVHVRTVPGAAEPLRLDAERLTYQREKGLIRARGEVQVERGEQRLQARTLSLFLREDRKTPESLRARFEVVGSLLQGEAPNLLQQVRFQAESLVTLFNPGTRELRRVELRAGEQEIAEIQVEDEAGLQRRVRGTHLMADMAAGQVTSLSGRGQPMELVEGLAMPDALHPLRHACARSLEARFEPDGSLRGVRLKGQVELEDSRIHMAGGETATLDLTAGRFDIQGKSVQLLDERGEVTAPSFVYSEDRGVIRAQGGVQAVLAQRSARVLESTPLGGGQGPVQVVAEEGIWTLDPPSFVFRGEVRAWRGDNLLLAKQLRSEGTNQVAASGGVKTLWIPQGAAAATTGGPAQAVEVSADQLFYSDELGKLQYQKDVILTQAGRRIRCRDLDVELGHRRQAERMICTGNVRLEDPVSGRRLTGKQAVYTLAQRLVEVFGERVRMLDKEGNEIEGKYLTYNVDSGAVSLKKLPPDAAGNTAERDRSP